MHNLLIAPAGPGRGAGGLALARRLGVARFNFRPAYFVRWTPGQLRRLAAVFSALRLVLTRWADAGRPVEVVNLSRHGTTPLYNDSLTVDTDGEVYASNLVLAEAVRPRRSLLRLGRVSGPRALKARPTATSAEVLGGSFPAAVLDDTRRADAALTAFCRALEEGRMAEAR